MRPVLTPLAAGVLALALSVPLVGTPAAADPRGPVVPPGPGVAAQAPGAEQRAEQATAALAEVQALLGPATTRGDGAQPRPGGDPTIALRDLALLAPALPPEDQRLAAAYLARPTDDTGAPFGVSYSVDEAPRLCNRRVCVHRVASTDDKATATYARTVLDTVSKVHSAYVGAGYRKPKSDAAATHNGGNARPDIYLADIGDQGLYGYCTSDQPRESGVYTQWAYCVLDNNYAQAQYPQNTPAENLRVTAAHEYFHAIQFGYDFTEDAYFLEGTATWAEDELYDGVDDNTQYLPFGPMGRPGASLDRDRGGLDVYGVWSFFRFLTERFPRAEGGMPVLVRTMWRRADALGSAPDDYSLQAIRNAVKSTGGDLTSQFAAYSVANRHPAKAYAEGKANSYPQAPLAGRKVLSPKRPVLRDTRRADHLSAATYRLQPAPGLRSGRWRVRLDLDLPPRVRGSVVRTTIYRPNGNLQVSSVALDKRGDAVTSRPFDARHVAAVEVTLLNASQRIDNCFSATAISCQGIARDDRLPQRITARLVRRG